MTDKSHINIYVLLIISLLLLSIHAPLSIQAQGSYEYQQEELPEKSRLSKVLAEKTSDKYDYRDEKEKEEKEKQPTNINRPRSSEPALSPELRNIIKYTLFGLVILVLSFIAFRLVTGGIKLDNKKVKLGDEIYSIEDIEDQLHEVDVEAFLQQAIQQKDYRLGIRLYYLAILKELSLSGHIKWKKDKTNGIYIQEMRRHPSAHLFRKTTYIYEYVWFNEDEPFGELEFEEVRPIFKKMLTSVQAQKSNA